MVMKGMKKLRIIKVMKGMKKQTEKGTKKQTEKAKQEQTEKVSRASGSREEKQTENPTAEKEATQWQRAWPIIWVDEKGAKGPKGQAWRCTSVDPDDSARNMVETWTQM